MQLFLPRLLWLHPSFLPRRGEDAPSFLPIRKTDETICSGWRIRTFRGSRWVVN